MQMIGLPRQITRGAALASRLLAVDEETARRRDAVARWNKARADGLTADRAAAAVGVPRSTLYRWAKNPRALSRRPRNVRRPQWTPELVEAVRLLRADYRTWGKAKIARVLQREGWATSEATVGRILSRLMRSGDVVPVPLRRRKSAARRAKPRRPHAQRLPKGRKPTRPGEIVQLDTLTVYPGAGRPVIKQSDAACPVSKWVSSLACRRATAGRARFALDKIIEDMPFPIGVIQVDGGSEFMAEFEERCAELGIGLYVLPSKSPQLNGCVERCNGTWRCDFHADWILSDDLEALNRCIDAFADEFNTYRPHQGLGGLTPQEYLEQLAAREEPDRLICSERGQIHVQGNML